MTTGEIALAMFIRGAVVAALVAGGVWLARKFPPKPKKSLAPILSKWGYYAGRKTARLFKSIRGS